MMIGVVRAGSSLKVLDIHLHTDLTASLCSANLTVAGRYKQNIAQSYKPSLRARTPPARPAIACGGV
eukprot:13669505-Heterocapsa_arctica.AAC.1